MKFLWDSTFWTKEDSLSLLSPSPFLSQRSYSFSLTSVWPASSTTTRTTTTLYEAYNDRIVQKGSNWNKQYKQVYYEWKPENETTMNKWK